MLIISHRADIITGIALSHWADIYFSSSDPSRGSCCHPHQPHFPPRPPPPPKGFSNWKQTQAKSCSFSRPGARNSVNFRELQLFCQKSAMCLDMNGCSLLRGQAWAPGSSKSSTWREIGWPEKGAETACLQYMRLSWGVLPEPRLSRLIALKKKKKVIFLRHSIPFSCAVNFAPKGNPPAPHQDCTFHNGN